MTTAKRWLVLTLDYGRIPGIQASPRTRRVHNFAQLRGFSVSGVCDFSATYVFSMSVKIPTPPASTFPSVSFDSVNKVPALASRYSCTGGIHTRWSRCGEEVRVRRRQIAKGSPAGLPLSLLPEANL